MLRGLKAFDSDFTKVVLVILAGIAAYAHTLDIPFYLDDIASIVDNPAIVDLSNIRAIWDFSPLRFIGYYSFALNFAVHGSDVLGYHIVNISIHLLTSVVIYLIVSRFLQLQNVGKVPNQSELAIAKYVPFVVALFFVLHPLNTQAVSYVVQRLASMSALFYLCTLYFYLSARMSSRLSNQLVLYALTILLMIFACLTKQNAFTLPLAIILIEACFFAKTGSEAKRLLIYISSLFLLALGLLTAILWIGVVDVGDIDRSLRETDTITRKDYLTAQILVVWKYIGLFFWPHPLNLDYDNNAIATTFSAATFLGLLGHISLIGFSILRLRKLPLVAFGVLFYYLTLSVESSVIPIRDLMFEHRTYLPNFGLLLAVIYLLFSLKVFSCRFRMIVILSVTIILGTLSWQRNDLWRHPVAFYDAAIKNSPGQSRNWVALSQVYFKYNEDEKALSLLRKELRQNQIENDGVIDEPLYVLAFWSQLLRANGLNEKANRVERTYGINKDNKTRQRMLLERGNNELLKSRYMEAAKFYQKILVLNPNHENAQINLGVVAMMERRLDEAELIFLRFPNNSVSRSNLPLILDLRRGDTTIGSMERKVFEKTQ